MNISSAIGFTAIRSTDLELMAIDAIKAIKQVRIDKFRRERRKCIQDHRERLLWFWRYFWRFLGYDRPGVRDAYRHYRKKDIIGFTDEIHAKSAFQSYSDEMATICSLLTLSRSKSYVDIIERSVYIEASALNTVKSWSDAWSRYVEANGTSSRR